MQRVSEAKFISFDITQCGASPGQLVKKTKNTTMCHHTHPNLFNCSILAEIQYSFTLYWWKPRISCLRECHKSTPLNCGLNCHQQVQTQNLWVLQATCSYTEAPVRSPLCWHCLGPHGFQCIGGTMWAESWACCQSHQILHFLHSFLALRTVITLGSQLTHLHFVHKGRGREKEIKVVPACRLAEFWFMAWTTGLP